MSKINIVNTNKIKDSDIAFVVSTDGSVLREVIKSKFF